MDTKALRKRIDKMLAVVEDQQRKQPARRVIILLPIKDNEPAIPYTIEHTGYTAVFFVPENRLHESA